MKWKVKILLLFLVAATTITLVSCKPIAYYLQQVYKAYGKVTDAGTGSPLESVEVFLGSYQYSVLTNGLGDYGIELAEGTWTLHFVKSGYVTVDKVVTVNASIPRVKIDAQLTALAPPSSWVVGDWGMGGVTVAPFTNLIRIKANGTYEVYDNYDGSTLLGSGSWSLAGSQLTLTGLITLQTNITKVNDNQFSFDGQTVYRKGYAPGGYVFDQTETVLSSGVWTDGSLAFGDMKLYSFTASSAGTYTIAWQDKSEGGGYTGDIMTAAYKSDRVTPFFINEENIKPSPQTLSLAAGEKIYLIVEAAYSAGTFRVMVSSAPEFVGTWQLSAMETGRGALTVTLTATSFTITAADAPPPSPDLETDTGTVSDIDTTLKHLQLHVQSVTLAGEQSAKWAVGDVIFLLYSVSGNTITGSMSTTGYPADLTGGVTLTRLY